MKKIIALPLVMSIVMATGAFAADEIHWTVTGQNSVTINWHGDSTENTLTYSLPSGTAIKAIASHPSPLPYTSQGTFWQAKLTGLKENSAYFYAIGNGPKSTFRTPVARGAAGFNVYAEGLMGDTKHYINMGGVQSLIASDIAASAMPAFIAGLGDLSLGSLNGQIAVHQHFNDVMTWSKTHAYMPVWGDYDVRATGADNFSSYKGRFDLPNAQTSPGATLAGGEDWYWFDYGNTRFITLPEPTTGAWADWQAKADNLMAQAQATAYLKFIVTFVHRPAYSSGHYAGSSALKTILDGLGDRYSKYVLNVNAHSANYERTLPQHGVVHVTAGTGGKNLMQDGACLWLTCTKPAWSAFRAMHLGALKLSFTAAGINGSFLCGPAGGGVNDMQCKVGSALDKFSVVSREPLTSIGGTPSQPSIQLPVTGGAVAMAANTTAACTKIALSLSSLIKDGGYGYRVNKVFGTPPDTNKNRNLSKLRLFENGEEIGPAHSFHYDIRNLGAGRFAHWSYLDGSNESLRFSATDNSNPRTNGKSYSYCIDSGSTTTGDTSAPAAPGNMKATAVSSSQINLSWSQSADNVGVTGYKIYKNGVLLTTTNNVSYAATGLAAETTYNFYVTAYDAAGNVSANSATASATTTTSVTTAPSPTSCAPAPTSSLVVNVKDKGALGNGSANDTAAIQAAIDQVAGTGGTVYVPDGVYMIDVTKQLFLKSNMTFRMSSGTTLRTISNNRDVSNMLFIWNYNYTVSNVNVIGGTLEGDRYRHNGTGGQHGHNLSVSNANNVYIENVVSKNAWGDGFYVGYDSKNVALCNVTADYNRRHGITVTSGNGVVVKNSVAQHSDGFSWSSGIDLEPNDGEKLYNAQVLNSQFLSNRAAGLAAVLTSEAKSNGAVMSGILIQGNTVNNNGSTTDGTAYPALAFYNQTGAKLLNNTLKNNSHTAIYISENTSNSTISGNTIVSNGTRYSPSTPEGYGIILWEAGSGNTISNNTLTGNNINLYIGASGSNNTVTGNVLN